MQKINLLNEDDLLFLSKYSPVPTGISISSKNLLKTNTRRDLSVIIPCYNSEQYIKECLDSVLEQKTIYDYEVIAINDGSTDKTSEILKEYTEKYDFLKVITQENKGYSGARNAGIVASEGRFLMFVDSDDYVSSNYIQNLLEAAYRADADVCACGYYSFYGSKRYKTVKPKSERDLNLLNGCFWGKIFDRKLFEHVLLPEGFWYEDTILPWLIFPQVNNYMTIDTCCYAYRRNLNGITQTSKKKIKAIDTVYITDLMMRSVSESFIKENSKLVINQFYINQLRLLKLSSILQKRVFEIQSRFYREYLVSDVCGGGII